MRTAVFEVKIGANGKIVHRARDQNLALSGVPRNPCGDMHRDSADLVCTQFDFARVQTGSDWHTALGKSVPKLERALDCPRRPIEDG